MPLGFGLRLMLALALWVVAAQAQSATVENVRVWSGPESTRVVLDLSAPAQHRWFSLTDPHRIVIDLSQSRLASGSRLPEGRGFVSAVRTGERPGGELRVVLDLHQAVEPRSFMLEPDEQQGHRLVIDLMPRNGSEPVVRRRAPEVPEEGRPLVIAIDAGHGGEDPGAIGRRGVREKDVTLAIARRLAQELEREPGFQPVMIRTGDYFLPLRRRIELAHQAEADLFVSIHADAHRNASASGATVYALSQSGASDEAARRLAERENAADLVGGGHRVSLAEQDELVARVLLDMTQHAAISASLTAGEHVIGRLSGVTPMRRMDVQQARFVVLMSPDIPSLLIETAYISNPAEEAQLHDPQHQAHLAHAIYAGIVDYFVANPPSASYVARNPRAVPSPLRHVVSRGETLSGIAQRHRVSLTALRQLNGLSSDVIRVGQVLLIPRS